MKKYNCIIMKRLLTPIYRLRRSIQTVIYGENTEKNDCARCTKMTRN